MFLGRGAEVGICLKVDKHAREPWGPSLSLYLENGKVKHYEKEKHWNTRLN